MTALTFTDRFAGQIAIITGGASGIGLYVAARITREGGRVSLWDCDAARLAAAQAEIGAAHTHRLDIADPEQVARAAAETAETLGKIDVLVCSAGITGPNTPLADYPIADWKQVNIASVAGKEGNPNASAYSTSKAGVIGLTKSLGKELSKTEIRVNCVTPAAVKTAIFDQMSQEHIDFMLSKIPIGRFGGIAEVASLVCWLASAECSFSTGAVFDVSGGRATY
jgi:NAD(P)-dependent dehydrogenase (short-subunit alcohol dehydrogenase family)